MAVNLIVALVTLFIAWFIIVWIIWPSCRSRIEAPKFPPTQWDVPLPSTGPPSRDRKDSD